MTNDAPDREAEIREHIDPDKTRHGVFVSHAHTDIAYLLDALDRAREALRDAVALLDRIDNMSPMDCHVPADELARLRALLHPEDADEGGKEG